MMKQSIFSAALAVAFVLVACERDEVKVQSNQVSIRVGLGENASVNPSRVAMTDDATSMALAWEADDAVRIISSEGNEQYDIQAGFSDHDATFSGNVVPGSSFTVVYPGNYATVDALKARSLASQTQACNASTAHLEYNAMLEGLTDYSSFAFTGDWATANSAALTQTSVLRLYFQFPTGVTSINKVSLTANTAIFPQSNDETADKVTGLTLNITDGALGNHVFTGYLDLGWPGVEILSTTTVTISAVTNLGEYTKTITPGATTLRGGKMYTVSLYFGF